MKRAAVIWSSPNPDGLTASAKKQFMQGLTDAGVHVDEIHLNSKKIEHCRACGNGWGNCRKGACIIEDDFAEIYKTLAEADGIVWISAVYWWDMTECFKAFFDRLRRCDAFFNKLLRGKNCVIIACAGGTGRGTLECLGQFEKGMTQMGVRVYDRISIVRYNKDYILPVLHQAGETYADRLENGFE